MKFEAGRTFLTPGVLGLMAAGVDPMPFMARHLAGDWGDVCAEDHAANEQSLRDGSRLLSAYRLPAHALADRLLVITEADRSATTLLLPE